MKSTEYASKMANECGAIQEQIAEKHPGCQLEDESVREWFRIGLVSWRRDAEVDSLTHPADRIRHQTFIPQQARRPIKKGLQGELRREIFAEKHQQTRDRMAFIEWQQDVLNRLKRSND